MLKKFSHKRFSKTIPEIFDRALNTPLKKNMFKVTGKDTIWGKVFKNGPSKRKWKTAFKKFEVIWSAEADHITSNYLNAVFYKIYLVYS